MCGCEPSRRERVYTGWSPHQDVICPDCDRLEAEAEVGGPDAPPSWCGGSHPGSWWCSDCGERVADGDYYAHQCQPAAVPA